MTICKGKVGGELQPSSVPERQKHRQQSLPHCPPHSRVAKCVPKPDFLLSHCLNFSSDLVQVCRT